MDAQDLLERIRSRYDGLDILSTPDAEYVYYDPARDTAHDKRQPFTTIVLTDAFDQVSALYREGVYRLNIGVRRDTYRAMFGEPPTWQTTAELPAKHDLAAVDVLIPHPIYSPLGWISINAPSEASWPRVRELLDEAYDQAKRLKRRGHVPDA